MKIRLLLLRICDHELIKSDITEESLSEIVSDIKDFDNSKINNRFEVLADMKKIIECSNTCSLINHERVDFCYDFGEKDCIVDNENDIIKYSDSNFIFLQIIDNVPSMIDLKDNHRYSFGRTRDLSVGNIGISAFYSEMYMADFYQEDYGVNGNILDIVKSMAEDIANNNRIEEEGNKKRKLGGDDIKMANTQN